MSRAGDGAGMVIPVLVFIVVLLNLHWILPLLTVFVFLGIAATVAERVLGVKWRRGGRRRRE